MSVTSIMLLDRHALTQYSLTYICNGMPASCSSRRHVPGEPYTEKLCASMVIYLDQTPSYVENLHEADFVTFFVKLYHLHYELSILKACIHSSDYDLSTKSKTEHGNDDLHKRFIQKTGDSHTIPISMCRW